MTKHLFAVVLSFASFVVPTAAFAQLGTAANPIYIQDLTPTDPFANLNQQIQQQQILNAMNAQTQVMQQAALQQTISNLRSQYGYSAYATCASRGGSVCNSASPDGQQACVQYVQYCLQMTTRRSPVQSQPQTTAPSPAPQIIYVPVPQTVPTQTTQTPAPTIQTGSSDGGGGGIPGQISCDKMVMGKMTHFGTMSANDCNTVWQAAVVAAQKQILPAKPAPAQTSPAPKFYVDTHPITLATTATPVSTPTAPQSHGFWSWLRSLFGLADS